MIFTDGARRYAARYMLQQCQKKRRCCYYCNRLRSVIYLYADTRIHNIRRVVYLKQNKKVARRLTGRYKLHTL